MGAHGHHGVRNNSLNHIIITIILLRRGDAARRSKIKLNQNKLIKIMNNHPSSPSRREFLRVGALGLGGLSLGRALELLERAPLPASKSKFTKKPAKTVILIWLDGGASHIDTFDAKPGAPEEVRGNWQTISTPVPGTFFGKGLERVAAEHPNFSLIRSLVFETGEHEVARHHMLTGYARTPVLEYPSHGSVVSNFTKNTRFPPYLLISTIADHAQQAGAGFLPAENAPFLIDSNPARPEFSVRDLLPPAGLDAARVDRRRALLEDFDQFRKSYESSPAVRARSRAFERAWDIISNQQSREAFDITKENDKTRARFGNHALGQSCLLARRLAEAGARFITIMDAGWDHHSRVHEELTLHRLPKVNDAIPALFTDLRDRGLWDETLIIMMSEFGRTPKMNSMNGRDHWPRANCCLFAGGAIRGGMTLGATDANGEQVVERAVSPSDLAATIYTILGIDPDAELLTPDGRPVKLVQNGSAISEILA